MSSTARVIGQIHTVLRGTVQPYPRPDGSAGDRSAIDKHPVAGPVAVRALGLEGDEQGNLRVHGGPDKAVHHYAQEHYPLWRAELGELPVLQQPGAFGENLASTGVTEASLCWGDQVRIGSTLLELAQLRQPCWKLNVRFGQSDMALRVQSTGRTGWYWRVLQEGQLQAGDAIELVARPHPEWPLTRVVDVLYHHALDRTQLQQLAQLRLPASWEKLVQARLEHGQVEDWARRVHG